MAARQCGNCGAAIARRSARFCEFCGTEMPKDDVPPPPSRFGDLEHRFAGLHRHPDLPELMSRTPSTSKIATGLGCGIAFLVLWTGVAIFLFVMFQSMAGFPFSLFPLLFVAIGVFGFIKLWGKASAFRSSPLERIPALVAGERTAVSGGGNDTSATTTYYVTLEFEGGERKEFAAGGRVAGSVTEGDLGIAYLKGEFLLDYGRVRV